MASCLWSCLYYRYISPWPVISAAAGARDVTMTSGASCDRTQCHTRWQHDKAVGLILVSLCHVDWKKTWKMEVDRRLRKCLLLLQGLLWLWPLIFDLQNLINSSLEAIEYSANVDCSRRSWDIVVTRSVRTNERTTGEPENMMTSPILTAVGPFQLPAPQSGTLSRISSETRPSVQTLSDVCLKRTCSLDTSAFSALEVLDDNRAL